MRTRSQSLPWERPNTRILPRLSPRPTPFRFVRILSLHWKILDYSATLGSDSSTELFMLVRLGRRRARCLRFEALDSRLTLCAEHMLTGVASADGWIEPGSANGVPLPPDWPAPSPVPIEDFTPVGAPAANGLPM